MENSVVRGRKWLQFSLRTLMLITLVCGLGLGCYLQYLNRPIPLSLEGYCPVTLVRDYRWERGNSQYGCVHRGQRFRFASAAEQAVFEANPPKYAPVCEGHDVVSLADQKRSIRGKCTFGIKYKRQIYLFESAASLQKFFSAPAKYEQFVRQKYSSIQAR